MRAGREREKVARFISEVEVGYGQARTTDGRTVLSSRAGAILRGFKFDVHAAREAAQALLALESEQAVFEDWTRARGLGPENREPGAFDTRVDSTAFGVGCQVSYPGEYEMSVAGEPVKYVAAVDETTHEIAAGLAHAVNNDLHVVARGYSASTSGDTLTVSQVQERRGGWPGKLAREWPGDSRAPMGRTLAKLGRLVLAALEGQPSECQGCKGDGLGVIDRAIRHNCDHAGINQAVATISIVLASRGHGHRQFTVTGPHEHETVLGPSGSLHRLTREPLICEGLDDLRGPCPDCHGTGHNLRGVLPAVDIEPVSRRKAADEYEARLARDLKGLRTPHDSLSKPLIGAAWIVVSRVEGQPGWSASRSDARGYHRDPGVFADPRFLLTLAHADWPSIDERITARTMHHEHLDRAGHHQVPLLPCSRLLRQGESGPKDVIEGPLRQVSSHPRLPQWRRGEIRHATKQRMRTVTQWNLRDTVGMQRVRGAVLATWEVTSVEILSSNPDHVIEVLVEGGTDADVARSIFESVPAGVMTRGNISVVIDEPGYPGGTVTVRFSRRNIPLRLATGSRLDGVGELMMMPRHAEEGDAEYRRRLDRVHDSLLDPRGMESGGIMVTEPEWALDSDGDIIRP